MLRVVFLALRARGSSLAAVLSEKERERMFWGKLRRHARSRGRININMRERYVGVLVGLECEGAGPLREDCARIFLGTGGCRQDALGGIYDGPDC